MGTNVIGLNVNKRDMILDLKKDEDRQVALNLIAGADVFIQNFRGGVIERLKLGWEDVRPFNPRLVYCSISRSEAHTSELQSLMRISYAVFRLKKKNKN